MSDATPPEAHVFGPSEFAAATGADRAAMADLRAFLRILTEWNERMNLVGPSALAAFWARHAYNSAQLLEQAPGAKVWADLGAGAGFPGVVLAILLKEQAGACVHLVESMAKRCMFLREVVETLALPAVIHNARAEDLKLSGIEVVTARALAPMPRLLEFAWPLLRPNGDTPTLGLFLKGESAERELTEARTLWDFHVELVPSLSDRSGRIVRIERLRRVRRS